MNDKVKEIQSQLNDLRDKKELLLIRYQHAIDEIDVLINEMTIIEEQHKAVSLSATDI